ncbi:hypothetical protein J5I95_09415 [Candidatus Poribacteria bacterium]|nr:hypothetical protein [Candidatus Poribacteria bacterium]
MKNIFLHRISPFLILTPLLLTLYTFAQNDHHPTLPKGVKAYLGRNEITDIKFSDDGTRLAVSSTETWIYDAHTGDELFKLTETEKDDLANITEFSLGNSASAFSLDGETIATAAPNGTITLWDTDTNNRQGTFSGHKSEVSALAFSQEGTLLASGTHGEIRLWDVISQRERLTFNRYTNKVLELTFLENGKTLASVDKDGTLRLWETTTGELRTTFAKLIEKPKVLAFSPNGTTLATANSAGILQVRETTTGREIFSRLTAHIGVISTLAFTPNSKTIVSGGQDGTIRTWDATTGNLQLVDTFGRTTATWTLVVSADGSTCAGGIPADADATIQVWDATTGKQTISIVPKHVGGEWVLAISPDGTRLASGGRDGKIFVMNTETGKELLSFTEHTDGINTLVFSHDGTRLASSGKDGKIRLWDVDNGNTLLTLTDDCGSLAFSPDRKILASVGRGINLWNLETGIIMKTLTKFEGSSTKALVFSPDSKALVAGGIGLKSWNVDTGDLIMGRTEYANTKRLNIIQSLEFSPDGKILAIGDWDGILLWEWDKIASFVSSFDR